MGEIATAIDVLRESRPFVEAEHDPVLVYCLRHNLVDYLSKSGRFEEAAAVLPELKALAATAATELDRLRLRWMEARILAGTGRGEAAAELYQGVRAEFATRELWYDTALISLELACLYVAEGRTERVKSLAGHLAPAFQAGRVHREAVAALAVFRQAADRGAVTVELAKDVHSYLLRARRDPGLRFDR